MIMLKIKLVNDTDENGGTRVTPIYEKKKNRNIVRPKFCVFASCVASNINFYIFYCYNFLLLTLIYFIPILIPPPLFIIRLGLCLGLSLFLHLSLGLDKSFAMLVSTIILLLSLLLKLLTGL